MATMRTLESETYLAAADLSSSQYLIVKVTAEDTVNVSGANEASVGVLQNEPKSGEPAVVMQLGISKVVSNGSGTAIAAGDNLVAGAGGKAVKSSGATGQQIIGKATAASTADGTIIGVDLTHGRSVL